MGIKLISGKFLHRNTLGQKIQVVKTECDPGEPSMEIKGQLYSIINCGREV